ncbi:hypothetical protein BN59_00712 [Legionella massiliensis]|uniref:Uncharacterized protein n=1 Tax=Legionella massiliensis TaxID=1034943 RepID=A0A078KXK6_9GAMM|nr:hypothetical protein [Legionella massiliensis]CDZ76443.1 hypothetical protein BN59_00712 [Legionella massiliensis]CEE12181.1 hypothetical protein BN1094_00712 [Legionella massiliensis]
MLTKYFLALSCLLKAVLSWAINPIDVALVPPIGLPALTQIGNQYIAAYTFTNNLRLLVLI